MLTDTAIARARDGDRYIVKPNTNCELSLCRGIVPSVLDGLTPREFGSHANSHRIVQLPHDATVRPLFSAAMAIGLACSLLALAYGVARLLHRFGLAANTAMKLVFGAASRRTVRSA